VQGGQGRKRVLEQNGFGNFKLEFVRRHSGFIQYRGDHADQIAAAQLGRREVDRDLDVIRPVGGFAAGRF
jgi:hypothetical protein